MSSTAFDPVRIPTPHYGIGEVTIVDSFELRMVLPFALGVALVPLAPCGLFAAHLHGRREAAEKAADARSLDRRVAAEALARR